MLLAANNRQRLVWAWIQLNQPTGHSRMDILAGVVQSLALAGSCPCQLFVCLPLFLVPLQLGAAPLNIPAIAVSLPVEAVRGTFERQ
jgi:hypothetical protein